jgi:hypothetical protein
MGGFRGEREKLFLSFFVPLAESLLPIGESPGNVHAICTSMRGKVLCRARNQYDPGDHRAEGKHPDDQRSGEKEPHQYRQPQQEQQYPDFGTGGFVQARAIASHSRILFVEASFYFLEDFLLVIGKRHVNTIIGRPRPLPERSMPLSGAFEAVEKSGGPDRRVPIPVAKIVDGLESPLQPVVMIGIEQI